MTQPDTVAHQPSGPCPHGHRRDADYWHAWQEGRRFGRDEMAYGAWRARAWVSLVNWWRNRR